MIMIFSEKGALILGLTRENLIRLETTNPIFLDCTRPLASVEHIMVLFGETKVELLDKLAQAGLEIPQAIRDDAEADPL